MEARCVPLGGSRLDLNPGLIRIHAAWQEYVPVRRVTSSLIAALMQPGNHLPAASLLADFDTGDPPQRLQGPRIVVRECNQFA